MIRTGAVRPSSESCSCEEANGVSLRVLPRLEDLFAPPLEFLDPLELVFINDNRYVASGRFPRGSHDPPLTLHQYRVVRAQSISRHFDRKLHLGINFNDGVRLEEDSTCRDIDSLGVILLRRRPQRNLKVKGKP